MTTRSPGAVTVSGISVELSHADKVFFPDSGITKGDLVGYYRDMAGRMVPYLRDRPLVMARYPDGITGERIFQKNVPRYFPEWITRTKVKKQDGTLLQVVCDKPATLVYLANQACVEMHCFLSRVGALDRPDQVVFDLDPPDDHRFADVKHLALRLRELLEGELGLTAFVKTTGGKGVHVMAPIEPVATWDEVKPWTRTIAEAMVADSPDRYVSKMSKRLRTGHILVDYLRNGRGATAVAAYSTRSRPGAPVSTPLSWDELGPDVRGAHFRVDNLAARLAHLKADPWSGFFKVKQQLPIPQARGRTNKSRNAR